tara:strand:+ start:3999 stop:6233 length:2235 start_codon:yes stop_codon:yes gene_type:complete
MRYVASLLRNNYSNPPLAVVREVVANALDANAEANSTRPIEVTIPSTLNPRFIVRDFGGGLSEEDVFGLYSKYGKSTKRGSNNYIGAFGIGKFAPLSYGDNFTVVSYHNGTKSSYNVFVNEDDDTQIAKLHSEVSDEADGLCVEVAIVDTDTDTFRGVVRDFFTFFSQDELPHFIGLTEEENFFPELETVIEAKDGSWFMVQDERPSWERTHAHPTVLMGRVKYPLDATAINFDGVEEGDKLHQLACHSNLYVRVDIGELKLHHSRESLEYNAQTQAKIIEILSQLKDDVAEIAKEKLVGAEDLWDAKIYYAQVVNALPYSLRDIFSDSFEWDGVSVSHSDINRSYKWQDEVTIREYRKSDEADATDGYKVTSSAVTRIHPQVNAVLAIQDLKSTHGNALRARTLFSQNDKLEVIYLVSWDGDRAEEYVYDVDRGMGFSKIKKERFVYFSDVEKAKLQSRGRAVSGESRGDVPFFEFDSEGRTHRRNTDYWLNCTDSIDDLESGDRELIYVPLANYKVVDEFGTGQEECISLESLRRDISGVFKLKRLNADENEEVNPPLVIGVRRKDCSKLTKSRWVSWQKYKQNFAKGFILEHKDKVLDAQRLASFDESRYSMDSYKKLSSLLDNGDFRKLLQKEIKDRKHPWRVLMHDIELMTLEGTDNLVPLQRLLKYMESADSEWVQKHCPFNSTTEDFNQKCNAVADSYPLLTNLSKNIYSWQSLRDDNLGKNILNYIFLCDMVGGGE